MSATRDDLAAEALGTTNGTTANLLHRLVKHGKIARISRGLYRLTDQP